MIHLVFLRSASKEDIGSYSCVLENQLGAGKSAKSAYLDVHYPPKVEHPNLIHWNTWTLSTQGRTPRPWTLEPILTSFYQTQPDLMMSQVRMRMEPVVPVNEMEKSNVTLYCDLEHGNPPTLHAVRWWVGDDDDDVDKDDVMMMAKKVQLHSCLIMSSSLFCWRRIL